MKINKLYKLCLSIFWFMFIIIISTLIVQIPQIKNLLRPEYVYSKSGIWVWILMWLIIALECSIIPGPYIPFLIFFSVTPIATNKLLFWGVCTSAVVIGRIGAYFVGKFFGNVLLRRVASDSYVEWQQKFNKPSGKTIYAITVAAPGFPDFVLAWVAGFVQMNFWFYVWINVICKAFENLILIYLGIGATSGGNIWFYTYVIVAVFSLVTAIVLKIIDKIKK